MLYQILIKTIYIRISYLMNEVSPLSISQLPRSLKILDSYSKSQFRFYISLNPGLTAVGFQNYLNGIDDV